jgi:hypothetical protein
MTDETTPPTEDLRAWGYAPGGYMFICLDCPADISIIDQMARSGDKRSRRCREHAIAARDAAVAVVAADPAKIHRAHCYQGEYAGTCKYGDSDCPAATAAVYVIWWTTQTDCEIIIALTESEVDDPRLAELPDWLRMQLFSRFGRAGRGRLWNAFPEALPNGVEPWPDSTLGRMLDGTTSDKHNAGGIVIPLGDLHLVIGLPGFVTTTEMTWIYDLETHPLSRLHPAHPGLAVHTGQLAPPHAQCRRGLHPSDCDDPAQLLARYRGYLHGRGHDA